MCYLQSLQGASKNDPSSKGDYCGNPANFCASFVANLVTMTIYAHEYEAQCLLFSVKFHNNYSEHDIA